MAEPLLGKSRPWFKSGTDTPLSCCVAANRHAGDPTETPRLPQTSSTATPLAQSAPRTDWALVVTAVVGGVVAALFVGKVPPALPAIRADLGLSLVAGGFVVSMFSGLGMLLAAAVGTLADRLGRRRLVTAGFSCLVVGGLLGALAGGLPALLVSRFLEGVGFIAVGTALPAVVAAAALSSDRPLAITLWSLYTPGGMTLAILLAPLVIGASGWRMFWLVITLVALLAGLAVIRAMGRVRMPAPPAGRPSTVIRETLAHPPLLMLALCFGTYALNWVSLMVWLPTFLSDAFAAGLGRASVFTALVVMGNLPGILLGGWLVRRGVGLLTLVTLANAVMVLCVLGIFPDVLPPAARLALCVLFSLAGGLIPAVLFNAVPRYARSAGHLAAANGMLMQGSAMGQFIGAPIVAASVSAAGGAWTGAITPMVVAAAVSFASGWALSRQPPTAV